MDRGRDRLDVGDLVRMFEAVMGNLTLPAGKGDIDGRQGFNAGDGWSIGDQNHGR